MESRAAAVKPAFATIAPGPNVLQTYGLLGFSPIRRLPEFLTGIDRRYGRVARFRLLTGAFYLVSDPAAIADVLVAAQHDFAKMDWASRMALLLGDGLLTSEEPKHRQMRRIVQPAFHRTRIERYARQIGDAAKRFADELPDRPFDMHAAMTELTLRIASKTLLGTETGGQAERVSSALHCLMEMFPKILAPFGALRLLIPSPFTRRFRRLRDDLDAIVLGIIAQRRAEGSDRGDALSMLLESCDAETGAACDDRQVRDEAMTLFVAGHETTANALTWTWYLLANHPLAARRLLEEVQTVRTDPAAPDAPASFPYAVAILHESMRLYPPAWIIGRRTLRDVSVGGYHVPKGASVLMSPWVVHRSPELYHRSDAFVPERWLDGGTRHPFAYFPFGGGARRCIGEHFAWMEMLVVLVTLARTFTFSRVDARTIAPQALVTLRPSEPVMLVARR